VSPSEADLQTLFAQTNEERAIAPAIIVIAPDDPEQLTLRALRALQSAEVILFDRAVGPAILDFARREARRMLVGPGRDDYESKRAGHETNMIALSRAGRRVVRLVGAEVANVAAEEIAACRAAGVMVEVVPESGISSQWSGISRSAAADSRSQIS
jgi:uroporphyrin-III C-methyltransferase/precorrin-2 dehydrogenase/sirohydrochlorin ferrochelatase